MINYDDKSKMFVEEVRKLVATHLSIKSKLDSHTACNNSSQILEWLWGPLTTLHFQTCGVESVAIGLFTPIGKELPPLPFLMCRPHI
jgi:hypothetical protein